MKDIPGPIASSLPTLLTNRRLNPILAPLKSVRIHKVFIYNGVHWRVVYSPRFYNKSIFLSLWYNAVIVNLTLLVKSFLYISRIWISQSHLIFPWIFSKIIKMHIDNFMASVKHLMPLPWLYQNITLTNSTQQPDTSKSAAFELVFSNTHLSP